MAMTKMLYGYPACAMQSFRSMNMLRTFTGKAHGDFSFISYGERKTMRLSPDDRTLMGTIMNARHWHTPR
jgi:hypothetical protein